MFNNLKKEITIMKNFMNYICLFLMVIGINVSVNAATEISITPDPIVVNVEMEGEGVVGTLNFTYSITDAFAKYYDDTYGYYQVALDNDDDYEKILLDSYYYVTFLSVSEEVNVDFVAYESGSYDGTITCYAYTDIYGGDYVIKEVKFTINVTNPQPPVVLTNYQTYCPRTVMFDLNGLSGEAPTPILTKKNLTITDPGAPATPVGTDFLGWYNSENDQKWNFETDVVTEDMLLYAKCQSALTISGNVHLTSGKDVQVYTTPATNNMITVSWFGKDVAEATKIRFSYYLNDAKVEPTNSPFRVCYAENYNIVNANIDNAGENFEQTFAVSYKPTAYNQLDNYTIRVEAVNSAGTETYRTADLAVYGRSLPEEFVIAIKKDNQWYAVPNVLATSSSATAAEQPDALAIEVNDNTNPTYVLLSDNATNALYKSASRQTAGEHRGAIRLQSVVNDNYITATTSNNTYFYMKSSNDQNQQFYLNSTDCNVYKVTLDPAEYKDNDNTPTRWMSIYGSKIGWYNTTACNVYFLPIKTITEEIEVNDGKTESLSEYEVDETTTVIVHAGGTLNADKVATIGTLTIEVGQTKSGQIKGDAAITITGDAYMQLEVDPAAAASPGWYAFAVPFPVDALNGIYCGNTKLTNEVGYAIMDYHGDVRAQGQYGWKKYRGILQPGVFYYLTVGDTDYKNLRFHLKKDGETYTLQNNYSVNYIAYPSENDQDAGYNGVANKTLENVKIEKTENMSAIVYTYNNANKVFGPTDLDLDKPTFLPAQPFFVVVDADGSFNLLAQPTPATAPRWMAENEVQTMSKVKVTLANESYTDNYYVSASSDAKAEYEQLKDAVKMGTIDNNTKVPQIASVNYNNTILSAEYAQLMNGNAFINLLLYAPTDGEYTIAATECKDGTIYLTQNGADIWNLKDAFTLTLTKGITYEYGLHLVANSSQTPTNINGLKGNNKAQKIFKDYNIYILRDAQMYNTQGVKVQ